MRNKLYIYIYYLIYREWLRNAGVYVNWRYAKKRAHVAHSSLQLTTGNSVLFQLCFRGSHILRWNWNKTLKQPETVLGLFQRHWDIFQHARMQYWQYLQVIPIAIEFEAETVSGCFGVLFQFDLWMCDGLTKARRKHYVHIKTKIALPKTGWWRLVMVFLYVCSANNLRQVNLVQQVT